MILFRQTVRSIPFSAKRSAYSDNPREATCCFSDGTPAWFCKRAPACLAGGRPIRCGTWNLEASQKSLASIDWRASRWRKLRERRGEGLQREAGSAPT
jgi:hypothetical protein